MEGCLPYVGVCCGCLYCEKKVVNLSFEIITTIPPLHLYHLHNDYSKPQQHAESSNATSGVHVHLGQLQKHRAERHSDLYCAVYSMGVGGYYGVCHFEGYYNSLEGVHRVSSSCFHRNSANLPPIFSTGIYEADGDIPRIQISFFDGADTTIGTLTVYNEIDDFALEFVEGTEWGHGCIEELKLGFVVPLGAFSSSFYLSISTGFVT